jgi:Zn-dependent protease
VRPSRRILGAEFGRDELRHVALASLALATIFEAAFARNTTGAAFGLFPAAFAFFLPLALAAAVPPFVAAMVAQKRVAARQGCTTEFRVLPQWLLISVLFAFLFGFVFAAPGTTARYGTVTRVGAGKMSAAVPLAYTAVGFGALLALMGAPGALTGLAGLALATVARVNGVLAAFSMIPIPGFPGSDIWRWSKPVFGALIAAAAFLYWASVAGTGLGF